MRHSHGEGDSPRSYRNARDVVFLGLRDTVICTECELISNNLAPHCRACGSRAVLSLSRVLGGSLQGQETARLVRPEVVDARVRETLRSMDPFADAPAAAALPNSTYLPWQAGGKLAIQHSGMPVGVLEAGARRCRDLTGASAAAVAISDGRRVICRARAGSTAPEVGVEVPEEGLTALCLRTGQLWRCDDAEREPWANRSACRTLGIRSMVIAPMVIPQRVIGVLEVFSPLPAAFDDYHSATVQFFASALTVFILKRAAETRLQQPKLLPADDPSGTEGH